MNGRHAPRTSAARVFFDRTFPLEGHFRVKASGTRKSAVLATTVAVGTAKSAFPKNSEGMSELAPVDG